MPTVGHILTEVRKASDILEECPCGGKDEECDCEDGYRDHVHKAVWDESKHPRIGGKFAPKGTATRSKPSKDQRQRRARNAKEERQEQAREAKEDRQAAARDAKRGRQQAARGRAGKGEASLSKPQVTELQELLKKLGYDAGPTDGEIGPKTRAAIQKFRKDNDLAEGANLGERARHRLRRKVARKQVRGRFEALTSKPRRR